MFVYLATPLRCIVGYLFFNIYHQNFPYHCHYHDYNRNYISLQNDIQEHILPLTKITNSMQRGKRYFIFLKHSIHILAEVPYTFELVESPVQILLKRQNLGF